MNASAWAGIFGLLCVHAYVAGAALTNATYCWGSGREGKLGSGLAQNSAVPVPVAGNHSFLALSVGPSHACGLDAARQAWCWGQGNYGQLGQGLRESSAVPVAVTGGTPFASLFAGPFHTCSLDLDGFAWCWGRGARHDLDIGLYRASSVPQQMASDVVFTTLGLGVGFTCGLDVAGAAWCWGTYRRGVLGIEDWEQDATRPYSVSGDRLFSSLGVGAYHTCALEQGTGKAYCWGQGETGQLGWGARKDSAVPAPVAGGRAYSALFVGDWATCGLEAGTAHALCWGLAADGQLDMEAGVNSAVPVQAGGNLTFVTLAIAFQHSCGLQEGGEVHCWGDNNWGQLGADNSDYTIYPYTFTPVPVAGAFATLAATWRTTCGLDKTGAAFCWGANFNGELGAGLSAETSQTPVPVAGGLRFASIALGTNYACGQVQSGTADPLPPAASPPPPPLEPGTSPGPSGSSPSIGAIVGGIAGGLAILALLAFLALRPGKGWLRKAKPAPGAWPAVPNPGLTGPAGLYNVDTFVTDVSKDVASFGASSLTKLNAYTLSGFSVLNKASTRSSLANDELLSFISTRLGTGPQSALPSRAPRTSATDNAARSSMKAGQQQHQQLQDDMQRWAIEWGELKLDRRIGQGSYGAVFCGMWHETPVAIKVLVNSDKMREEGALELPQHIMGELQEEAVIMTYMRHTNCVNFFGVCMVPPCIITELCLYGSLFDVIQKAAHNPDFAKELSWQRRLNMALGAATGMLYLHHRKPPIIHCDLKSPNLLVDETWRVKVTDFNLSKLVKPQVEGASQGAMPGNPIWLAPEIFKDETATTASDVYAFGLIMWELLTWRLPWEGVNLFSIPKMVLAGERPPIPPAEELPGAGPGGFVGLQAYIQLMGECWATEPGERPTFADIAPRLRELVNTAAASGPQLL